MKTTNKILVTVGTSINRSMDKVWDYWTKPEHITKWYFASHEWHAPKAENDLRAGGRFAIRMEAKDESQGFDLKGTYDKIIPFTAMVCTLDDGRKVTVTFTSRNGIVEIKQTFEAEDQLPVSDQKKGWQAILDNFRVYALSIDQ